MRAHTPGPWWTITRASSRHVAEQIRIYAELTNGECEEIATVYRHLANCEDNARLIAAAPELLAACKRILELGIDANCGLNEVAAAIRKAEGEQV